MVLTTTLHFLFSSLTALSLPHHVLLRLIIINQWLEVLHSNSDSSQVFRTAGRLAHTHAETHAEALLSCYHCGCLISQTEWVSDIRLTCFLCSGAFLQRHGDQGKKRKTHLIELMLCTPSTWPQLSDGCADYNAPQHVSNMPATPWAAFQNSEDTVQPSPTTNTTTSTRSLLVPFTCCPWVNTHVGTNHQQASQENWLSGCFLFAASSSKRTIRVVASRVQWRSFLFWIAAIQQSIRGSWGFE